MRGGTPFLSPQAEWVRVSRRKVWSKLKDREEIVYQDKGQALRTTWRISLGSHSSLAFRSERQEITTLEDITINIKWVGVSGERGVSSESFKAKLDAEV